MHYLWVLLRSKSTHRSPDAHSPAVHMTWRARRESARLVALRRCPRAVGWPLVAVFIILIPRMHFATEDPPPLVAQTTGDRTLRRKTEEIKKTTSVLHFSRYTTLSLDFFYHHWLLVRPQCCLTLMTLFFFYLLPVPCDPDELAGLSVTWLAVVWCLFCWTVWVVDLVPVMIHTHHSATPLARTTRHTTL